VNSESKVLITSHDVLEAKQAEGDFSTAAAKTFFIDDFMTTVVGDSVADAIDLSSPDGLAYMIYTSGSTGKPKGAMLHQAGLRNFIAVVIDMEKLTANDRISGHRSFSFDAHIEDMYPVLTLGGSFHIMPTEIRKDLAAIRQFLIDHQCTGGGYSTAMTSLLLNTFDDLPIRFTTGGGEKMDGVYSDHIEIINVYGPTECTDDTSYYAIAPGRRVENIPIGQSVANNWNFIVDTAGNLVPQGVAGELCFAGVQVGRGYWRLPERTAKSFVDCPFVKQDRWGRPVRMYHTGDLCRWNEDGQIEYMGRIDTQVKLRGFRIELGEIESKALNIEGIRQAAAEVRKVMGNEHLVLYYTVVDGFAIGEDDIRKTLAASSLADYMVPDAYMQMDSMPMTPNGKINRKALPAPEMKRATEYEPPKGENEELFCSIFSEILKIKEVGATDNFFELGGTSLMVTRVIIEADKNGHHIAYGDVFANPTPRQLSNFISGGANDEDEEARDYNYGAIEKILQANTLDAFRNGEKQPIGNALVTGATGFLGIHILKELLERDDVPVIWCLVRGEDDEKAERRLKSLMFYYFNKNYNQLFGNRLRIINGDVTQEIKVNDKIDTVFNCAAVVKHFSKGTEIEDVNVGGALNCVKFCLFNNARLIHVSTYSTAGMSVDGVPAEDSMYTEQKLYFGQSLNNQYIHSKFLSERVVLDAVALHKLNAKVMRVGNLAPRSTDGEFQINFQTNSSMGRIRVYQMLGCYPYELTNTPMEFSPINEVAKAIVLLSETPQECCVFHPFNDHYVHFGDVLAELSKIGEPPRQVEAEAFGEALEAAKQDPEKAKRLSSLIAYQDMAHGQKTVMIPADNQYTSQVLYRLGFRWSTTSWDYMDQMLDAIAGFGYFEL